MHTVEFQGAESLNMSLNASSNITLPSSPTCNSSSSVYPFIFACLEETFSPAIFATVAILNIVFVLPMCGFILWRIFHQWQGSGTAPSSQSDIFVFYLVITEIIGIVGTVLYLSSSVTCALTVRVVGYYLSTAIYPAQTCFHCLKCVERYMAVVHPIAYRGLRTSGGLQVRHISCWFVWLICIGLVGLTGWTFPDFPDVVFMVILSFLTVVVSFCSLAVLHNLLQPKVGGKGIDQSKLRAFYSIALITGTLLLRFVGLVLYNIVLSIDSIERSSVCTALLFASWLCFPSVIVVPLLYLHKEAVPAWLSCNSKPGEK